MDDLFEWEMWHDEKMEVYDCAVLDCNEKTQYLLCRNHLGMFFSPLIKFLVCWNCNSLVKSYTPKGEFNWDSFVLKKFIFCERCRNCGDINDEKKIVLNTNNKIL